MDELPLKLEKLSVVLIDRRECGKIEVPEFVTQTDDAQVIHLVPLRCKDAVAEGEKALTLPSQLFDLYRRVGKRVEVLLEPLKLLISGIPDKVSDTFDPLSEFCD